MRTFLINSASYIVYLLPFSLLTGPFFPDLSVVIVSIIFIFLSLKYKLLSYFKNRYFIFFIIFYIYIVISSLFSDFKIHSLSSSLFYFRFIIFSLAIWFLINEKKDFLKIFSIFLFITFSIALFDGYYQYFFNENIFGYSSKLTRLNILLNDDLILGGYLARLMPLMIGLIILHFGDNKFYIASILFFIISCDVLIYLSGERTALGLLFLSTVLIIIFVKKFKLIRLFSFLLSVLIILTFTILSPEIKKRNIDHTINQLGFNSIISKSNDNNVDKSRLYIFSPQHHSYIMTSLNIFLSNPVLGSGPNVYRYLCSDKNFSYDDLSCSTHPHNSYAQIFSEIGLIGFLFIFVLIINLIYQFRWNIYSLYKNNNKLLSDYQVCLFACFFITLWPFLPTQDFFNNWINIIYYLPVGFYLASLKKDNF